MPTVPSALTEILEPELEEIWTFAYVSRPTTVFTDRALRRLHLASQTFNGRNGLTGRLVVVERDGRVVRFAQVVEGPREALQACAGRIFADPRHGEISMIQSSQIPVRRFSKWAMRYDTAPEATLGAEVAVALWRAERPATPAA